MNGGAMKSLPWEINTDLTQDRIKIIANLICQVRTDVIDRHDEALGDTRLSLGTRAYECCRTRIIALANSKMHDWLDTVTDEGRFTFRIGNTPVRFTRNTPENLPNRKLIVSEEAQQLLFFDIDPDFGTKETLIWFFIIDTPYMVPVETMYMVAYTQNKEIRCQWEIPVEEVVPLGLTLVNDTVPQPVELPPAIVTAKADEWIASDINEK